MADGDVVFSSQNKPFDFGLHLKDIPYIDDGDKSHLLDVLYPDKEKDNGVLLFNIHGGGYVYGYKENSFIFASIYANKGFTVISMNYTLMDSKKDISIKDQIKDVLEAIVFTIKNKEKLNLNFNKICLMGDSAGGHIALMAALTFRNDFLRKYYGVDEDIEVDIFRMALTSPMYDFVLLKRLAKLFMDRPAVKEIFSKFYKNNELLQRNSPKYYLSKGFVLPKLLLVYAKSDFFKIEPLQLKREYKKLKRKLDIYYEPNRKCTHIFHHFNLNDETTIKANNAIASYLIGE